MFQLRPERVFPLSSTQGALRDSDFYECVKCLVDTLNLIYDHNNNGAAAWDRSSNPGRTKFGSIKHGKEMLFHRGSGVIET